MRTGIRPGGGVLTAAVLATVTWAGESGLSPLLQDTVEGPVGPPVPPEASDRRDSFWSGWKVTISAGVNGSDGNSENFNVRAGAEAKREAIDMDTSLSLTYSYATDDGEPSKHRAEAQGRNDWKVAESPWGFFVLATGEYDEFQSWKYRASLFLGPSYRIFDDDRTLLRLRTGIGFTHEFGKEARNELIPELDLGVDFEHKLTERQKVFVTFDYFPSLQDFSEFRTDTKAGWEIVIDPEVNMSLKLGVNHRHNSEPGEGKKPNDLEYFAMIGWTF